MPRGEDAAQRIRRIVPEGVDGLIDAVVGVPILPAIRDGGGLAAVRGFDGETERGIAIHLVRVSEYVENQTALNQLGQLAAKGKL